MSEYIKRHGSQEMFKQSLVYLYNSYREDGLSAKEAKLKVAQDVENIYGEYAGKNNFPPIKTHSLTSPKRLVEAAQKQARDLKNTLDPSSSMNRHLADSIIRTLESVKSLLK
jgi:hypothetical protein